MSIEQGSPEWERMNEAVDATIETLEEGILAPEFPCGLPSNDGDLLHALLSEFWEAAFEAGQAQQRIQQSWKKFEEWN